MPDANVSRRRVLQGVAAGAAATGLAGEAAAEETTRGHVVGFEPGASTAPARRKADGIRRELDFGDVGKAVSGYWPEEALDGFRNNPNVRYVEENGQLHALAQTLPWGIDRVDADVAHSDGFTGSGGDIAILDTGIDSDHPDLQANIQGGKCHADECCGEASGGIFGCDDNTNDCNHAWDDDNDHGTHCAGIADAVDNTEDVVGVSTEANLWAGKVLNGCGSGSYDNIAAGIEWAADQGFDVASMSLGGDSSSTVKDACQYAYDNGVLLVAAAGNDGPCTDCVGYPAAYDTVVAVSSTAEDDSLSDFSSTGPEVELAAPGTDVLSTVPPESSSDGTATFSGTSMACPHVSGAGAILMANGQSNTTARSNLQDTAEDIGLGDNEQGYGLLDAEAAADTTDGSDSNSAPTVDSLSASEVETSDSDAEFDVDWSVSDSDGNLSSVDLTLTDDSDGSTEDTASISVSGDTASGTTRLVAADDDGSGHSYTVDCTVTDSEGATDSDSTSVSETEDTSSAPTVDSHTVSTRTTGPWTRVTTDWAVSDDDGDLDAVDVSIEDSSGNTLASTTNDVSGSTASGSDELKTKSTPSESVVTVTDSQGNSDTSTKSV